MWRFNNRTPVKTKRSWTESETKFLANTCLVEEPDDDANDIAKRILKYKLLDNRTQQAIETRISLIRRAANGESGWSEIPQQVKDVVRGMQPKIHPIDEKELERMVAEETEPAPNTQARKVAIGLKLAALTMKQLSTVIDQLIDDLEENNVTKG
jgi:acetolactate synthase small subunit